MAGKRSQWLNQRIAGTVITKASVERRSWPVAHPIEISAAQVVLDNQEYLALRRARQNRAIG